MDLTDFQYDLPREAIAQRPVHPRDSARLLSLDGLADYRFSDLGDLLAPGDLLVVNRTRVRPARLVGGRATGGSVEILLLAPSGDDWTALIRPAKKLKVGERIQFGPLTAEILEHLGEGQARVGLESKLPVEEAIAQAGRMPLPPYIEVPLADAGEYQTVYAREIGSAAAPTAGLHFTPELIARLEDKGIEMASVVLEVGLDTFRPIAEDDVTAHQIHSERIEVGSDVVAAVERTRARAGRVVAVGTTSVRALESAAIGNGLVAACSRSTDLYITPGYQIKVVDGLITNFHLPGTTLLVMIAALFGDSWKPTYTAGLERGYRFLSFGDAMFGWVR